MSYLIFSLWSFLQKLVKIDTSKQWKGYSVDTDTGKTSNNYHIHSYLLFSEKGIIQPSMKKYDMLSMFNCMFWLLDPPSTCWGSSLYRQLFPSRQIHLIIRNMMSYQKKHVLHFEIVFCLGFFLKKILSPSNTSFILCNLENSRLRIILYSNRA